jgi:hypothetical protein
MKFKKEIKLIISFLFIPMMFVSSFVVAQNTSSYDIQSYFMPTGYMGDTGQIRMVLNHTDSCHSDNRCIRITYNPGTQGWAGVYWQYPANNWCSQRGKNLSDSSYTRIIFWAKGQNGGEAVKFKAGQDCGDSFFTDEYERVLTQNWQPFTIDLQGRSLTNITGAFCWVVDSHANNGRVIFYLDDIKFE